MWWWHGQIQRHSFTPQLHLQLYILTLSCCSAHCALFCAVQVLDEIGVDLSAMMGTAPQRKVAQQQPAAAAATSDSELQDLQARLAMLRS